MVRERKTIYVELLVTVGLLVVPSLIKAVSPFVNPHASTAPEGGAAWAFASLTAYEILLLLLVGHVLRLNNESFAVLTEPFAGKDLLRGFGLSIWSYVSIYGL